MIGGHKVGVKVRGQVWGSRLVSLSGVKVWERGVKVRGRRVKVWGVGVRWSVRFSGGGGGRLEINRECSFKDLIIEFHSNPFHVLPNAAFVGPILLKFRPNLNQQTGK